jgi:hypothetical protein
MEALLSFIVISICVYYNSMKDLILKLEYTDKSTYCFFKKLYEPLH